MRQSEMEEQNKDKRRQRDRKVSDGQPASTVEARETISFADVKIGSRWFKWFKI